ncbi:hypothetical protein BKA81DRAFT_137064 [Phyllosticta paracitricarpa]
MAPSVVAYDCREAAESSDGKLDNSRRQASAVVQVQKCLESATSADSAISHRILADKEPVTGGTSNQEAGPFSWACDVSSNPRPSTVPTGLQQPTCTHVSSSISSPRKSRIHIDTIPPSIRHTRRSSLNTTAARIATRRAVLLYPHKPKPRLLPTVAGSDPRRPFNPFNSNTVQPMTRS